MIQEKKKIGVLFGGCSTEYGVSLQSAHAVITHMDREKYEPVLIGITREGNWYLYRGEVEKIPEDTWQSDPGCRQVVMSPDRELHGLWVWEQEGVKALSLDAAFPVLHGKNGEDGTVQGVLELAGVPVVGCTILASALCMDKDMAHVVAAAAGVRVPASGLINRWEKVKAKEVADRLGYPVFVKPLRAGSSFGITKVLSEKQLMDAVEAAFAHDSCVIMEEMIRGFEVGCAVMGQEQLTMGAVDEIELSQGFFDFEEKYTLKTSDIHVPARISREKAEEIRQTAAVIYRALRCSGFARVDMFLTPEGNIYFNEVNTIPGFTAHSRYPSMMKEIGMSFEEIVNSLIEAALAE